MTAAFNRVVRRFDDGCVVYRLHARARAVVLSDVDYQTVETLLQRKTLSAVAIAFLMVIPFLLYRHGMVGPPLGIFLAAAIFSLAFLAEAVWGKRLATILDAAPLSTEEQYDALPSKLDVLRLAARRFLSFQDDRMLRSGVIFAGVILLSSLFVLWKQSEGSDPSVPDTHPAILVTAAIASALCLRILLRERRKRRQKKPE